MKIDIRIPSPGESISEVEIASWLVENGTYVEKDQEIAEIESEKATLMLVAPESGTLEILIPAHSTVKVGSTAAVIDSAGVNSGTPATDTAKETPVATPKETLQTDQVVKETITLEEGSSKNIRMSPVAKKMMEENNLSLEDVLNGLHRIVANDIQQVISSKSDVAQPATNNIQERKEVRTPMSQLRKKLAQRLVAVKNETAMLTTFNEVDMTAVMNLRKQYQKEFVEVHGVKLGIMSFFTKAVVEALKQHPSVNSMIDGDDLIVPNYYDISIAVSTPKGLMVPVVRDAQNLTLADMEKYIQELAEKGRNGRLTLEEMTGGTFTITNGGVFGSMMSTPIINPPQSGILGMHNIIERPIAVNGNVEIRPMMYVALSYDHRIIDGKDSVGFLVKVKEMLENPIKLLLNGQSPEKILLGL